MTDIEAIQNLKNLSDYCLSKKCCEGCIFKPIDYRVPNHECYFRSCPPVDAYSDYLSEKGNKKTGSLE